MASRNISGAILVVEDAEAAATTLELALFGVGGMDVLIASTGADALRLIKEESRSIQAVVTDLNMPVIDGFELIRRIRGDHKYGRVPVIVVSGNPDPRAPAQALCAGADAYFTKPYSPAQLRLKLEQLLDAKPTS